jgi:hypothetical protein
MTKGRNKSVIGKLQDTGCELRIESCALRVAGHGLEVSAFSPAAGQKTVGLIEKETLPLASFIGRFQYKMNIEHRTSNIE